MRTLNTGNWAEQKAGRLGTLCNSVLDHVSGALHAASYFGVGYLGMTLVASVLQRAIALVSSQRRWSI
jgi:hypothetical protein